MGWTISVGSITSGGVATIPANTSSTSRSITVTYSNGDCTCTKTITQLGTGTTPTECTSWGSWIQDGTAYLNCTGGTGVSVSLKRICITDSSQVEYSSTTVTFSDPGCNDTGSERAVPNSRGYTILQRTGCDCETPSTCTSSTHKLSSCVSADGGSNIQIGTYDSMEGCSGSWTTTNTPSWISNVSFGNGKIYATVSKNETTSERTGKVDTRLSDIGDDYFNVTQCAGSSPTPTGTCECMTSISSNLIFDATGGTKTTTYTPSTCNYSVYGSLPSWISSVTATNGTISATATENTSTSSRGPEYVYFKDSNGNRCSPAVGLSQQGASASTETVTVYGKLVYTFNSPEDTQGADTTLSYTGECVSMSIRREEGSLVPDSSKLWSSSYTRTVGSTDTPTIEIDYICNGIEGSTRIITTTSSSSPGIASLDVRDFCNGTVKYGC